ncbi:MAG: hypothetical protein LUC43_04315 [Burkholderiales bacterium]|nr:hypothetical protein [Burkholderiales bacterium]
MPVGPQIKLRLNSWEGMGSSPFNWEKKYCVFHSIAVYIDVFDFLWSCTVKINFQSRGRISISKVGLLLVYLSGIEASSGEKYDSD